MPPKSVTCSICSATVLKVQTLARTDGTRACRSHEGVTAEAEQRAAAERAEREKHDLDHVNEQTRATWRVRDGERSNYWEEEAAMHRAYIYSHCWTCDAEGAEARDYFPQVMIAMKRLEIRRELNLLNIGDDICKLMGGLRLIVPIKLGDEVIDRAIVKHVTKRVRDIVQFLGFVLICPECADKHGFKKRLDDMMPKPTWKQLEAMGPVVAGMEPVLRAIAEKKEGQS